MGDPPLSAPRDEDLRERDPSNVRDDPEDQYNIRIRASLKKRLKRLVIEEEKPMGVMLETMLELYLQRRARRADRANEAG